MPEPKSLSLGELIHLDLARYEQTFKLRNLPYSRNKVFWESVLFKAGFQAVLFYRLAHWFYQKKLTYLAWFVQRFSLASTGCEIEFNAEIGPGLFIAHPVGIVIGRGSKIGQNTTFFQGVSFGVKNWHPDFIARFPEAGDDCFFFGNASVIGPVKIGSRCVVAAHTLVNQDMPDESFARGVPADIIPAKGGEMIAAWNSSQTVHP